MSSSVQVIFEHDEDLSSEDSSDAEYMYDNFEDYEIDSDEEQKRPVDLEDGKETVRCKNEITVYVTVDDDHPDGPMPPIPLLFQLFSANELLAKHFEFLL